MEDDILDALKGLHEQATKERSHYYVASTAERAIAEIKALRAIAGADKYTLPCDVQLPPRTTIRKGCTLQALIVGLIAREGLAR